MLKGVNPEKKIGIYQILDSAAEKYADKCFLKFVRNGIIEERSYNQVRMHSFGICNVLKQYVHSGAHIAIIGKTSYEYIICMTGVILSGCVLVPFSPEISVRESAELFARADVDMLICDSDFYPKAEQIKKLYPRLCAVLRTDDDVFESVYSGESAQVNVEEADPDNPAVMIFTSGTTGIRKCVVLSSKALVANILTDEVHYSDSDTALSVLPMFHVFCFSGDYLKNMREGVCVCINGDMRSLGDNLLLFEPDFMRLVPMLAQTLLNRVNAILRKNPNLSKREAAQKVFGRNLKMIYSGGAYLEPELARAYDEMGIRIRQGYGMTEAGCRISVPAPDSPVDSVGQVISICDIRIQDGEIQVKTPSIMLGYYKMPEETAKIFTSDGWLRTGDIGYVTENRQLFITGRRKNLIILSSGENVSPEAIEKKFYAFPIIKEITVYGSGTRLVAEVFPNREYAAQNSIDDIEGEIKGIMLKLNSTAKPSHIIGQLIIRDEPFPKTESGKIKRKNDF